MTQQQYNNNFDREFGWDDTIQKDSDLSFYQTAYIGLPLKNTSVGVTRRTLKTPVSCQLVLKRQYTLLS